MTERLGRVSEEERLEVLRDMVREEFDAWHAAKFRGIKLQNRTEESMFVNAHAMNARRAELELRLANREQNKLQHRIHRQRVANRRMAERIENLQELTELLKNKVREADELAGKAEELLYPSESSKRSGKARTDLAQAVDVWRDYYPQEVMES